MTDVGRANCRKARPNCRVDWDTTAVEQPKPLKDGAFVPLFNGKDLTGWKPDPKYPDDWKVENGVLVGRGPGKHHLYSERGDYTDFHIRANVRISAGGNSGIYFRSSFCERAPGRVGPGGYEAQIYPTGKREEPKTGSLMGGKAPSPVTPAAAGAGEWFTLEVIAQGNRSRIRVNGKETADSTDPTYTRGHLALQVWDGDKADVTKVEFKSIEIKELPVAPAEPVAPKDTPSAQFARTKKLKGKLTVDFKNEFLKAAFEEITSQLQDQKLGAISVQYGVGVSQNTRVTYSGKDVTVEEALDGILKQLDLGHHVVSKDKDRYDGWLHVEKGTHRGYPAGVTAPKTDPKAEPKVEPKPVDPKPPVPSDDPDEKQARSRLDLAKECVEMGKKEDAGRLLKYVVKNFPKTKAAAEAKELMDKIK